MLDTWKSQVCSPELSIVPLAQGKEKFLSTDSPKIEHHKVFMGLMTETTQRARLKPKLLQLRLEEQLRHG